MTPERLAPQINSLIDSSDILDGSFSVESALMLASALVKDRKLSAVLAWSSIGYSAGAKVWSQVKKYRKANEKAYTVKVCVEDEIFDVISHWIIQETPEEEQYVVEAVRLYGKRSSSLFDGDSAVAALLDEIAPILPSSDSPAKLRGPYKNVSIEVDDDRPMVLTVDGHELDIQFVVPGQKIAEPGEDRPEGSSERYRGEPHFLITCPNIAAKRALLTKIDMSFKNEEVRRPRVYRANAWGDMDNVGDVPARALDTVILKQGQIETLVEDISLFLRSESKYTDLGIPYHHGVLLQGPPGTGKTSIAASVANALNLDVYAISLNSVRDDVSFNSLLRNVKSRSVLLIEDVDTCKAAQNGPTSDGGGVTLDGLLQSLDGFATPHGLVTVLTTNKPELLDPRLIRPGRADLIIDITCVDTSQVERLCKKFIGYVPEGIPELVPSDGISPAECVGVFKAHLYEKDLAGPALVKRLNDLLTEDDTSEKPSAASLMRLRKAELQQLVTDSGGWFTDKTPKPKLVETLLGA